MEQLPLPYYLDKSDPEVLILRRQDGWFAAAFSARGITTDGILEAAKEDGWKAIEVNADLLVPRGRG